MTNDLNSVDYDSQETTINQLTADDYATIYTCERTMLNKLSKLAEANPEEVKPIWTDGYAVKYQVPKKYIKISPPKRMNYSEEQLQAMRERAKRINLGKDNDV